MATVRRLNDQGILRFQNWLSEGAPDPVPDDLLESPTFSAALPAAATIEQSSFGTRLQFGEYLVARLKPLPASTIRFDAGLWDWLSLYYFDQLCPKDAAGNRQMRELVRYSLELKNRKWSRHLVRMSWMAVADHGSHARVLLGLPMTRHSDVLEQLAGQQETFGAKSVIAAADWLYWDEQDEGLKRGVQGKAEGTPRRLRKLMRQIRLTFDPHSMSADQLLALLPPEFKRWETAKAVRKRGLLERLFGSGDIVAADQRPATH